MVLKSIGATEAKPGTSIIVDGTPCTVKKMDVSKTGKHGHAKVRIEAVGIIDGSKKIFVVPGHDKLDVPLVEKKKGQVLSKGEDQVSLMDLESFETLDVSCPKEILDELSENDNVEYWNVEGALVVKRKL